MVILLVALLVLGPNRLPEAARQVGKAIGELRKLSSGFQAEMRDALKEPVESKPTTSSARPVEPSGVLASPHPTSTEAMGTEVASPGNGTAPADVSVPTVEPAVGGEPMAAIGDAAAEAPDDAQDREERPIDVGDVDHGDGHRPPVDLTDEDDPGVTTTPGDPAAP